MKGNTIIDRGDATDIIPLFAGYEKCDASHSFGPHIRGYYILHGCLSGKGTLYDRFGEHKIGAGELFIIRPDDVTTYVADDRDPWDYVWIAFKGERAKVFDCDRSVYSCPTELFLRLRELSEAAESSYDVYTAIIYEIIYRLFSESKHTTDTLSKIRKYIRYNYMMDLTAEGVANEFGYERSYLYRIFKKRYGMSIKEYIIKVRMENARIFLKEGRTVAETAAITGYKDEFNFSRGYKKYYGIPPSHTRSEDI